MYPLPLTPGLMAGIQEPEFLSCQFCKQNDFVNEEELKDHQEEEHGQQICEHPDSEQRMVGGDLECQLCWLHHGGPDGDGPDD